MFLSLDKLEKLGAGEEHGARQVFWEVETTLVLLVVLLVGFLAELLLVLRHEVVVCLDFMKSAVEVKFSLLLPASHFTTVGHQILNLLDLQNNRDSEFIKLGQLFLLKLLNLLLRIP